MATTTTPSPPARRLTPRAATLVGVVVTVAALTRMVWAVRSSLRRVLAPSEADVCPLVMPPAVSCTPEAHLLMAGGAALVVVGALVVLVVVARTRSGAPTSAVPTSAVPGTLGALVVVAVLAAAYVVEWPGVAVPGYWRPWPYG